MNIYSSNYDYYYYTQNYQSNPIANQETVTEEFDFSENETKSISQVTTSDSESSEYGNMMNLSFSGQMVRDSLQTYGMYSSEMSKKMESINTDMESIKTADIDNMTADELEEILTNLQTDMESIPRLDGSTEDTEEIDISSMSEEEMRELLEKIQEDVNNAAEMASNFTPMQSQDDEYTDAFSQLKEDTDYIKSLDIDSLTADEVEEILTNLQEDIEAIPKLGGSTEDTEEIDISSMSEEEMRELLEKIQEDANNAPEMSQGRPPMMGEDMSSLMDESNFL